MALQADNPVHTIFHAFCLLDEEQQAQLQQMIFARTYNPNPEAAEPKQVRARRKKGEPEAETAAAVSE